jgi:hypothetical protein
VLDACGSSSGSQFSGTGKGDGGPLVGTKPGQGSFDASMQPSTQGFGEGGVILLEAGPAPEAGPVDALQPLAPTVAVTIDSSGIQTTPVTFSVVAGSQSVPANFAIDRGDLGTLDPSTGVFTASGSGAGSATITATVAGGLVLSTTVTVTVHEIQNGGPAGGQPEAGVGGLGGVGGEGLGGTVPPAVQALLQSAAGDDAGVDAGPTSGTLAWLYPYDQTVWPRGLLSPLLQWTAPPTPATAVYIHLKEANYEFEGFYSGTNLVHQPIDEAAWTTATNSNAGDALNAQVTVTDGTNVYGPIAENWLVAPGLLKGTVYYASYYTKLANPLPGEAQAAGTLAIKPGRTDPQLAIPSAQNQCAVCHEVSADGTSLFVQNGQPYPVYNETDEYDLTTGATAPPVVYTGRAGDGTVNDRKFLWSGLWADGTFALQSSGHTEEFYAFSSEADAGVAAGNSRIFERDDGNAASAPGFDGNVTQAVTPAFSPDGTMVAFNFWAGAPASTLTLMPGNGHTLDLMDFACGLADAGPVTVTSGPSCATRQFSNIQRLYTNASPTGYPAWPAWLPDSKNIVFHNTVTPGNASSPIATWEGSQAQLWIVNATGTPTAIPLQALNGIGPDGTTPYLPTNTNHPNDTVLNYEPTVNPIASGGYYWVVFTSRRMYGNVAAGNPYDIGNGTYPVTKKLWVAAIDLNPTPGVDPSHPAFYLPAQELDAPNMRGFWVVDACQPDGTTCDTGDECCGGYCEQVGDAGAFACSSAPPPEGCSQEYDKCTTTANCCGAPQGYTCINGRCAAPSPPPPPTTVP